jgi:hypothetical protein
MSRGRVLRSILAIVVIGAILYIASDLLGINVKDIAFQKIVAGVRVSLKPEHISALEKIRFDLVKWFPFTEENALKEWEEKILKGRVEYRVEKDPAAAFVHAMSCKTASALFYKLKLDVRKKEPVVKWRWRVRTFPTKKHPESLTTTEEDDFAARIYVIFPAKFFTNSKVVEYIWAESLPAGETGISPYTKNIRLMVLRSGPCEEFVFEERDVIEDYVRLYGERPRLDVGAIAFMTDADTTGTSADAMYTDIMLGYKDGILLSDN